MILTKIFKKKVKIAPEVVADNNQLLSDMRYVCNRLNAIRAAYDMVSDNTLIDSLIYEENALVARYTYMLQLAKERKLTQIPMVTV